MNEFPPPTADANAASSTSSTPTDDRLLRPRDGRVLGGVCAGLADRYGWKRSTVRILAVLSVILPGPQVLAYVIAWVLLPDAADGKSIVDVDKVGRDVREVVKV